MAYLLSFLVIGRFWDTHRGLFRVVHLADNRVVWANLAVLLWVTLIPATAALLGAHWQEPAALTLYAADPAPWDFFGHHTGGMMPPQRGVHEPQFGPQPTGP